MIKNWCTIYEVQPFYYISIVFICSMRNIMVILIDDRDINEHVTNILVVSNMIRPSLH